MTPRSVEPGSSTLPYIVAVTATALLGLGWALLNSGLPNESTWFVALMALGVLAGIGRPAAVGSIQFSTSAIVQLAAIPLIGPVGAAVIAGLPEAFARKAPIKRVFNTAQRVLLVLAAALTYEAAGGRELTSGIDIDTSNFALQMALAALAGAVVNSCLLAGVLQITSGGSLRVITQDLLQQVLPAYATCAVAAFMLTILWAPAGLGWVSIVFFLPSLLVIQWGLRQAAIEWTTRHEAIAPFVTALDVRHPGAAEESRLTAGAASAIATTMGLTPARVDEVATAARLSDIGLLALDGRPAAIIRRDRAIASARVLGGISFLSTPLDYIAAHQERVDGEGRPHGLEGDKIPLGGRILAVADVWAGGVMGGRAPESALIRCESLAGTALDVRCVIALRRAYDRGLLPSPEAST